MRDKAAAAAYAREWRKRNKDHYLAYTAAWRAQHPEATRENMHRYQDNHREELRAGNTRYYNEHREERLRDARLLGAWYMAACLDHYGTACACCGSVERLTIDHIDHRGKLKLKGGVPFHRWLVNHGFPSGYQTLCLRCNISKFQGERCRLKHA